MFEYQAYVKRRMILVYCESWKFVYSSGSTKQAMFYPSFSNECLIIIALDTIPSGIVKNNSMRVLEEKVVSKGNSASTIESRIFFLSSRVSLLSIRSNIRKQSPKRTIRILAGRNSTTRSHLNANITPIYNWTVATKVIKMK